MVRALALLVLAALAGCADQSKGAALNECRLRFYLDSQDTQATLVPDCMNAKSFEAVTACNPPVDPHEWDWQVTAFQFNNPQCYRPVGATAWAATVLSPM